MAFEVFWLVGRSNVADELKRAPVNMVYGSSFEAFSATSSTSLSLLKGSLCWSLEASLRPGTLMKGVSKVERREVRAKAGGLEEQR